jgi:hypothetical protein
MEKKRDQGKLTDSFSESEIFEGEEEDQLLMDWKKGMGIFRITCPELARRLESNLLFGRFVSLTGVYESDRASLALMIREGRGEIRVNGIPVKDLRRGDSLIIPPEHSIQIFPRPMRPLELLIRIDEGELEEGIFREREGHRGEKPRITVMRAPARREIGPEKTQ